MARRQTEVVRPAVGIRLSGVPLPPSLLRRTRPRGYEEWKALRDWGKLPAWEPLRPGFLLRAAREDADLSQSELARRLGVSQQAVARAERADSNPTTALLETWARAVGAELNLEIRSSSPR